MNMTFERKNILSMRGYVPGEQPTEDNVIKLNTNENPYPASPKVAEALATINIENLRRYPSPTANEFRQTAAAYHSVSEDSILPTNGGDELLRLAITTFVDPGETVGIAVPSYSLYPVLTEIQGCKLFSVPLSDDWTLPSDFAIKLNEAGAKLALLVNPHAPTGLLLSVNKIIEIANTFEGVLLVDEAYVDFVDSTNDYDLTPAIGRLDNLLILRSLSKGFSLAGLRFGYGIGSKSIIDPMMYKTRDSYNTDYISQQLAIAALKSIDYASQTWSKVINERARLTLELEHLGLACLPSQSNFLLVTAQSQDASKSVCEQLKSKGILIRYFDEDRLRDKMRITVGTPEQNQRLLDCLKSIIN
jgi:histidinol-phosphate aminotransferase